MNLCSRQVHLAGGYALNDLCFTVLGNHRERDHPTNSMSKRVISYLVKAGVQRKRVNTELLNCFQGQDCGPNRKEDGMQLEYMRLYEACERYRMLGLDLLTGQLVSQSDLATPGSRLAASLTVDGRSVGVLMQQNIDSLAMGMTRRRWKLWT